MVQNDRLSFIIYGLCKLSFLPLLMFYAINNFKPNFFRLFVYYPLNMIFQNIICFISVHFHVTFSLLNILLSHYKIYSFIWIIVVLHSSTLIRKKEVFYIYWNAQGHSSKSELKCSIWMPFKFPAWLWSNKAFFIFFLKRKILYSNFFWKNLFW